MKADWTQRFWTSVQKSSQPDGCWIWIGKEKRENGYGRFSRNGRRYHAHRVSWELVNGPIPKTNDDGDEIHVCHNCPTGDNPSCVNPSHLFLGTRSENMQDSAKKGRHRLQRNPRLQDGKRNPSAKLIEAIVRDAREKHAIGGIEFRELAEFYHVKEGALRLAIKGKTWRHVGGPIATGDQRNKTSHWKKIASAEHGLRWDMTTGKQAI